MFMWLLNLCALTLQSRLSLLAEIAMLRQQLAILQRQTKRPKLRWSDRLFWVGMRRWVTGWREALLIVNPETVCRWHRAGYRRLWRYPSSKRTDRKPVSAEVRELIRQMANDNPTWGSPRIAKELAKLGFSVAPSSVAKYMPKRPNRRPPKWKVFLANHAEAIVACDFFTVPSATFRSLTCLVLIEHATRRIVHVAVTRRATSKWVSEQVTIALKDHPTCEYLQHDNGGEYGLEFEEALQSIDIESHRTDPGSPWQNGICERVVGTLKRECTNHLIPLGVQHLQRKLDEFVTYYNAHRCHDSLEGDTPEGREVEDDEGEIISIPFVGGLHHRYTRRAA